MTWVIDGIEMVSVDFIPSWKEVDENGQPTGKFKASVGQKYIEFKDLPEELQNQLREFVTQVMTQEKK